MAIFEVIVWLGFLGLALFLVAALIAKKRMDRNEPVWGWKRKQYLVELQGGSSATEGIEVAKNNGSKKDKLKEDKSYESIVDLMELKSIEDGIIERERNEFLLVLSTDFVNFSLLRESERESILAGYQQLFGVINFPVQLLWQAVRQDFSMDRQRFEKNLSNCNIHAQNYNQDVLDHIQKTTEKDFRITLRIFYVVKYIYEPSKMGKLDKEQKQKHISNEIHLRAEILRRALRQAKVDAVILDSVSGAEAVKRALNRDRMLVNPMRDVVEREKLSPFVTMDISTLPNFETLVQDLEGGRELVGQI